MKNFILLIVFGSIFLNNIAEGQQVTGALNAAARESFLQKASSLRQAENYAGAVAQLDSILAHNQLDAPVLLFKGDLLLQASRYSDAAITYKTLLPLNFEHTITQINLSYALFMNHQPAKALHFAGAAWQENQEHNKAIVNYFNALLWNVKTKEASRFLQQQKGKLSAAQQLVLQARLATTSGDHTNGLRYYDSLATTYPNKYYVQEYAEVLLGKKEFQHSADAMNTAKELFTANEYKAYQQKLKAYQLQRAGTETTFFNDVAGNKRLENNIWWQQGEGTKYRLGVSAGMSQLWSSLEETTKTRTSFARLSLTERWNRTWSGQTELFVQRISFDETNTFAVLTGKQIIQYQPNDRRMVGLFYSTDLLNFTASLLQKNVRSNNLGYVTHLMLDGRNGFYSQGSWGLLTDNNQRIQFFGSLYHLFRTEPTLKAGVNSSILHFADKTVTTYFSPDRYMSGEIFMDYGTALPNLSKFYLQLQAAAGMQKIEVEDWQAAVRVQTEIGMRLNHLETSLKYQASNVASATGTGYKFTTLSLRFLWKW